MATSESTLARVSVSVQYRDAIEALQELAVNGDDAVDRVMRGLAQAALAGAEARGGSRYGKLAVTGSDARYVVVAYQRDGRHIANYHNYGTLASRRPAAKRPGNRADHSKPGIKRKRFLRKPTKRAQVKAINAAIADAARGAGFVMR